MEIEQSNLESIEEQLQQVNALYYHGTLGHFQRLMNNNSLSGLPRVTFCGIVGEDFIDIGVARCSEHENYNKRIGRRLAGKRAIENPQYRIRIINKDRIMNQFNTFCNGLSATLCDNPRMVNE